MSAHPLEPWLAEAARFQEGAGNAAPVWVQAVRKDALRAFGELGLPTTKLEDWKYTDVAPIAKQRFAATAAIEPDPEAVARLRFSGAEARTFVFVNGRFDPALSSPTGAEHGVRVESLTQALANTPGLEEHLAQHARFEDAAFVALNTAFLADGALVQVADGAEAGAPIHLLHLTLPGAEPLAVHPRTLVLLGRGSRATLVEDHATLGPGAALVNAVTEVVLGENASLEHVRLQRQGLESFHVGLVEVHQARDARYVSHAVSLGAALARNALAVLLDGEGAECQLSGLFVGADRQHTDNQTWVDHARPHGTSRELYKGILDDEARGVFNGRVIVRPDAQKTNAEQQNRNLLLADGARVNTKPQLEIRADDVRCSHGSTIGQLDEDALFYLRSRGLPREQARALMTRAFASEVVDGIPLPAVRERTLALLLERIHLERAAQEIA